MLAQLADGDLPTHPHPTQCHLAWTWHFEYGGSVFITSDSLVVTTSQTYDNSHVQQPSLS